MDFQIKMNMQPGDAKVSKAVVKIFDNKGVDAYHQVILEGETAETKLMLTPGGRIEVSELERPLVYDAEQKAAVPADLTPDDKLSDPNRPKPGTPLPSADKSAQASGGAYKPDHMVDTKPAQSTLSDKPTAKDNDNKSKK